jgi:glycosyltransferase involved in cell wall biosynthesis
VVDDGSNDDTARLALRSRRRGLEVIRHPGNLGVGAAIETGYHAALVGRAAVVAVMAGDGQMDPADLAPLIMPVLAGQADYAKGNRLRWPGAVNRMPLLRWLGNHVMTWITRLTSGYRDLGDSQCGYTAASQALLSALVREKLHAGYGYPNDVLARLHSLGARVVEVPVRPVYGPDWRSGIGLGTLLYPILPVLVRSMLRRLLSPKLRGAVRFKLRWRDEALCADHLLPALAGRSGGRVRR